MRSNRRKHLLKARREQPQKLITPQLGKLLLFFLLVGVGFLILRLVIPQFIHKRVAPLEVAAWKRYSPGQSGLSLLLPGEPQPENANGPSPDPAVKRLDRFLLSVKEFRVAVWNITYQGEIPADLRKAAEGVAAALKESGEVTDYQETVTPTRRSGRSGMLVNGAFKRSGEERQFRALLLGEGDRLWQVVVAYPPSFRRARTASQRIINSVKLD